MTPSRRASAVALCAAALAADACGGVRTNNDPAAGMGDAGRVAYAAGEQVRRDHRALVIDPRILDQYGQPRAMSAPDSAAFRRFVQVFRAGTLVEYPDSAARADTLRMARQDPSLLWVTLAGTPTIRGDSGFVDVIGSGIPRPPGAVATYRYGFVRGKPQWQFVSRRLVSPTQHATPAPCIPQYPQVGNTMGTLPKVAESNRADGVVIGYAADSLTGHGLNGAFVELRPAGMNVRFTVAAHTDTAGGFVLSDLKPGRYEYRALAVNFQVAMGSFEIPSKADTLRMHLRRVGLCDFRLTDERAPRSRPL